MIVALVTDLRNVGCLSIKICKLLVTIITELEPPGLAFLEFWLNFPGIGYIM
jgi:hypothetical protein